MSVSQRQSRNPAARGSEVPGRELQERVVKINRVAKVVKGGRRFSFTALVVVGDEVDHVGVGYGKANEVPSAIAKAVEDAKKNLFQVPKYKTTITHQIVGRYGAGQVLLKPASEGTGVIAGAGVRAVLELGGVRDILAKSLGTANPINLLMATVDGLKSLKRPEDVAKLRGKEIREVIKPYSETRAEAEAGRGGSRRRGGGRGRGGRAGACGQGAAREAEATVEEGPRQGGGRRRGAGGTRAGARHPSLSRRPSLSRSRSPKPEPEPEAAAEPEPEAAAEPEAEAAPEEAEES